MPWKFLLIVFSTLSIAFLVHGISSGNPRRNSSMSLNNSNATTLNNNSGAKCDNLTLCNLMEKKITITNINDYQSLPSIPTTKVFGPTAVQTRSYYGYGGNNTPAYYPAFDSLSVLASLAFLAFLLQSFASLFDRSRSIIPTIVNSRQNSSPPSESNDAIKIIMRALDEYGIFSNNMIVHNRAQRRGKFS